MTNQVETLQRVNDLWANLEEMDEGWVRTGDVLYELGNITLTQFISVATYFGLGQFEFHDEHKYVKKRFYTS